MFAIFPVKVNLGNCVEFIHLSPLKCSCIEGLEKEKLLTAASKATSPVWVLMEPITVLFSALGNASLGVVASKETVAEVVVFFCAKRVTDVVNKATKRITFFIECYLLFIKCCSFKVY